MSSTPSLHPSAIVGTSKIGAGSSIGAYSRIGPDVEIGNNATIGEHVHLEERVLIADRAAISWHTSVRGPVTIGADVSIGPSCCLDSNGADAIVLDEGSIVGANATIWPGVQLGRRARVEPGSVVTKSVPALAVVAGNPAQIVRYRVNEVKYSAPASTAGSGAMEIIPGVTLHQLPLHEDLRGNLTFGEGQRHVPFPVKRYFLTFSVANQEVRGEHAHRTLEQFLVCVHGRVHIIVDNGTTQADFLLEHPTMGIYVPRMIWTVQYRFSSDAVLLGLCSEYYDAADYIRNYAEFLELLGGGEQRA